MVLIAGKTGCNHRYSQFLLILLPGILMLLYIHIEFLRRHVEKQQKHGKQDTLTPSGETSQWHQWWVWTRLVEHGGQAPATTRQCQKECCLCATVWQMRAECMKLLVWMWFFCCCFFVFYQRTEKTTSPRSESPFSSSTSHGRLPIYFLLLNLWARCLVEFVQPPQMQ